MKALSNLAQSVRASTTLAIDTQFNKMRSEGIDVIGFSVGQPDFPTPEHIKQAGIRAIQENLTKYTPTPGTPAVRKAVADRLEQRGVEVRVQTAIEMNKIAEPYIRSKAIRHLEKGRVVIFGCGTGNPYFSTDTGAVLRAAEINADAILLAKNIDGVYSADPAKDPNAVKYDTITYDEVLAKHLAVMDTTATSLSMDNHIPVLVFALKDPENILRVVMGEKIGTVVTE